MTNDDMKKMYQQTYMRARSGEISPQEAVQIMDSIGHGIISINYKPPYCFTVTNGLSRVSLGKRNFGGVVDDLLALDLYGLANSRGGHPQIHAGKSFSSKHHTNRLKEKLK